MLFITKVNSVNKKKIKFGLKIYLLYKILRKVYLFLNGYIFIFLVTEFGK